MAVRIRKSVYALPQGDTTISWYRKAVDQLLNHRPLTDPTSWRYLAAVHGVPSNMSTPSAAEDFWDQCQHQSWFFLSWHRGYVAAFEAVIANTIVGLGGPADWALPYWNYSEELSKNPKARLMPSDFFDKTIDGKPNALFSRRSRASNGDFGLDASIVTLKALKTRSFASSVGRTGFGGPVTGFNTSGNDNGGLENVPHNAVHGQIGGFMNDPATAALDPIFWLHHCNIDRLWEVWRNQGAAFKNPNTADWLSDVEFNMHDGKGKPFTYVSGDMLDTTKVLHGYKYDSVPVPQPDALESLEVAMADERGQPELAGANAGPITIEGDVTHTDVPMLRKPGLESVQAAPKHVYLSLENITGVGTPGNYKVYVEMPGDGKEPMLAGVMTTFGLERASDSSRDHGGSGLSHVFEITDLAGQLGLTTGTVSHLKVSFVRMEAPPVSMESVPGLEDYAPPVERPTSIKVGRVNLFYD
jgi:tyrosinase